MASERHTMPRSDGSHGVLVAMIVLQFVVILVLGAHAFRLRVVPVDMSYADWVAVLLTGVGLIISVLAVFLGILAFVGWQTFDRRVAQRVEEVLSDGEVLVVCLDKEWGVKGRLRKHLQDAVERASYDVGADPDGSDDDRG